MLSALSDKELLRLGLISSVCMLLGILTRTEAQTRLRLSTSIPGSERVQLVYNGDFQFQGPLITNRHPWPAGWVRQADMFADAGTNTVLVNSGVVALARVGTGGPICLYHRTVTLDPNTAYVLSAYLWNMGDSPNGQYVVSDGTEVFTRLWNRTNAQPLWMFPGHGSGTETASFSPDGTKILTTFGGPIHSGRLWNVGTGTQRDTLIGHHDDVLSVRFSPDGKTLASASYDQTVRLWDVATGKAVRIFQGHTNRVFSVAFSPDGKRLASAGDATLRIWDVTTGAALNVISFGGAIASETGIIAENLSSVAFSPDGNSLAVASTTGLAFLLSQSGAVLWTLSPPDSKK